MSASRHPADDSLQRLLDEAERSLARLRAEHAGEAPAETAALGASLLAKLRAAATELRARQRAAGGDSPGTAGHADAAARDALPMADRVTDLLESISDAFVAVDHEARVTYMNRRAEALLGRSRAELVGKVGWDAFPALRDSIFEREYRRATAERVPASVEAFYPPLQGWVELHAYPTAEGMAIFFRNITGRKRAEADQQFLSGASATLAASIEYDESLERVVRLAVPYLGDVGVLYLRDHQGRPRHLDVHARQTDTRECWLAALRPLLAPARSGECELLHGTDEGHGRIVGSIDDEFLRSLGATDDELPALRALGRASLLVLPLVSRGRPLGLLAIARGADRAAPGAADLRLGEDLAARAALALDNAWLYAEAQRAAHARQEVLHVVSHDLRNSLNAALLHIEVLLAESPRPDRRTRARAQVEAIQRAAHHMHRMVQDLLDAESVQAGRLSIAPEAVALNALARETLEALEPQLAAGRMTLVITQDDERRVVRADSDRVQQVLINLIGNAIKFSDPGGRIDLLIDGDPAGDAVRFRVRDSGPGIPAEELPHVFERHWQGEHGRRIGRGAGLGLTIARGIVEAHGGRIWAESEPGRGSTFVFTLPRSDPPA